MDVNRYFRMIPKVDLIMEDERIKELSAVTSRDLVLECTRKVTDDIRAFINGNPDKENEINTLIDNIIDSIILKVNKLSSYNMKKVINGTGTILHTNLGRAPISQEAAERAKDIVTGYSNLEFDLESGIRGSRYAHFEKIITRITGAEAALAVNNNAAAVLLILSALARDKEVIVSRGELVEIGGSFRVPDVMKQSGAKLVEVGTTNKTRLSDYEERISSETAALLKVHTSNYRIVGFTESVSIEDLSALGRKYNLPVIEDIGSGVLTDLTKFGLTYEPTVQHSIKAGVDIICFSGDKLLGGPQAGIIAGKKQYIDKIKKHPLNRAVRIDKFTAALLESVFHDYIDEEKALKNVPVLKMMKMNAEDIRLRAETLAQRLREIRELAISVGECYSQIGGGALPLEKIRSYAVCIKPETMSCAGFERKLRNLEVPIIGRVVNDTFLIDLRTVLEGEDPVIYKGIKSLFK
ncbi:MAG TPA: L-seryl-tRNA(Sec) selenium transferase [Sedimentibacter sp.]|jgi:L-seryl-tRNA(Ser) seleniumtransferase|nr:L-seryl-tRNA(Sec) selenium transferase [Sedimentibacter sp.]HOW23322.1 L-seryl-tRNA(Sec) selenium transferase [Sedimentibacter sp.]HRC81147.1 L-seryl-tRNA(Sec) selenium transferase [Sedimentibacter sp.]